MQRMTDELIGEALNQLSSWQSDGTGIHKDFVFADFNEAFAFLTRIAMLSEKLNHHAEWSGVYNKVSIRLSTHDAGGITEKDIKMATAMEGFVSGKK